MQIVTLQILGETSVKAKGTTYQFVNISKNAQSSVPTDNLMRLV